MTCLSLSLSCHLPSSAALSSLSPLSTGAPSSLCVCLFVLPVLLWSPYSVWLPCWYSHSHSFLFLLLFLFPLPLHAVRPPQTARQRETERERGEAMLLPCRRRRRIRIRILTVCLSVCQSLPRSTLHHHCRFLALFTSIWWTTNAALSSPQNARAICPAPPHTPPLPLSLFLTVCTWGLLPLFLGPPLPWGELWQQNVLRGTKTNGEKIVILFACCSFSLDPLCYSLSLSLLISCSCNSPIRILIAIAIRLIFISCTLLNSSIEWIAQWAGSFSSPPPSPSLPHSHSPTGACQV